MLSFHNDPLIKEKYLSRIRKHREMDNIIQGAGWQKGKGCAVGCTLESYNPSRYPIELGMPEWLAHLEDAIFEGLPKELALDWPERFLESIPVGVNLENVRHKLAIKRMDRLIKIQKKLLENNPELEKIINDTINAIELVKQCHQLELNEENYLKKIMLKKYKTNSEIELSESIVGAIAHAISLTSFSAVRSIEKSTEMNASESAAWSATELAAWSAAKSAEWPEESQKRDVSLEAQSAKSAANAEGWSAESAEMETDESATTAVWEVRIRSAEKQLKWEKAGEAAKSAAMTSATKVDSAGRTALDSASWSAWSALESTGQSAWSEKESSRVAVSAASSSSLDSVIKSAADSSEWLEALSSVRLKARSDAWIKEAEDLIEILELSTKGETNEI